jgi:hypothetical protein
MKINIYTWNKKDNFKVLRCKWSVAGTITLDREWLPPRDYVKGIQKVRFYTSLCLES